MKYPKYDWDYRKRYKTLKRRYYIMFFCCLIMAFMFFVLLFNAIDMDYVTKGKVYQDVFSMTNITYLDLNESDRIFFERVFSEINPIYLYNQEEIVVARNISKYCDDCDGQNIDKGGTIVIRFVKNENYLKEIISHEFMHTYIKYSLGEEDKDHPLHQIVYDLGDKQVVFN